MKAIIGLGKYLYAIPMLFFGINHFMNAEMMAGMAPFGGEIMIYITGVALVAAAISIVIGKLDKLSCVLLALLLLIIVFSVHMPAFMNAADEAAKMGPSTNMLKDIGLAGGALLAASNAKDNSYIG
jgi:uncharacterized membrane protein YphA (DoxX/SURF4 family)